MDNNKKIIRDLLDIKAVQIKTDGYFTWTSGLKSPIYCDNRLTMSYPEIRRKIAEDFENEINELQLQPDVIVGCATAGIPHAAILSERMGLPLAYVRSSPKAHGKGNQIEGIVEPGQKAIVIEDLISTGGSSIEVAKALQAAGVKVLYVFSIFTYGLKRAINHFNEINIPLYTISGFDELIDELESVQSITSKEKIELLAWRDKL